MIKLGFETYKMIIYKISGVEFPKDGKLDRTHKVVKGLIGLVNSRANLDSGVIKAFALTNCDDRNGFIGYSGEHAAVGYCFDPEKGEVYFVFRGKISPEIARSILAERYAIEEVNRMPGAFIPVIKKDLTEDIGEREIIEKNGCGKPDERRQYIPAVQAVKTTTLSGVLEKRVARGDITKEEADRILVAQNK